MLRWKVSVFSLIASLAALAWMMATGNRWLAIAASMLAAVGVIGVWAPSRINLMLTRVGIIRRWFRGDDLFAGRDPFFVMRNPNYVAGNARALRQLLGASKVLNGFFLTSKRFVTGRTEFKVADTKFINFGAKRVVFTGVQFSRCSFVDCLFLGIEFRDCEFHQCRFVHTCTHKIKFVRTYIDPASFEDCIPHPFQHANLGVHLFQQLCQNASAAYQIDHLEKAEFEFRRWLGREIVLEFVRHRTKFREFFPRWFSNWVRKVIAGYGLRPGRTIWITAILLVVVSGTNALFWSDFDMVSDKKFEGVGPLLKSLYFTVQTLSTLGYGDLTPNGVYGVAAVCFEALLGLVWLSFCASVIIKKVTR